MCFLLKLVFTFESVHGSLKTDNPTTTTKRPTGVQHLTWECGGRQEPEGRNGFCHTITGLPLLPPPSWALSESVGLFG